MRLMALMLAFEIGCWVDRDPCANGGTGCPASGTSSRPKPGSGYCSSDAACGAGLVCDFGTGACSSPSGGCGQQSFTPKKSGADVLLVLDRSSSMAGSTGTGTKWSDIVSSLTTVLADTSADINWGVELFPSEDGTGCSAGDVSVIPGPAQAFAVMQKIAASSPNGAGTPTTDAV